MPYVYYVMHIPTAIIIMIYFFHEWSFPLLNYRRCWRLIGKIAWYTALADSITLFLYGLQKLYGTLSLPLWVGFAITALSLCSLQWCEHNPSARWTATQAILLGIVQAIALIPGISRFALTFVALRWMNISARRALQISFLIEWPLMILTILYSCYVLGILKYEILNLPFLLVMLSAGIISYGCLSIINYMVMHHMMWLWSIYMLWPIMIAVIGELR